MIGLLIPVTVVAVLAVLVAMVVFIVLRVRAGEPLVLSFRTILLAYFYVMTIASLLVFTVGVSAGLKALLSDAFGREFSYFMPPAVRFKPPPPPGSPAPREEASPQPLSEEEKERNRRQVERQYRDDLVQGGTLTVVGAILWGLHLFGRRRLEAEEVSAREFFDKAHTTILLGIFSVVGVISLPLGIYELLRYFIVPADEFMSRQPPGTMVATTLVFVPLWASYLAQFVGRSRRERTTAAPATV